MKSKINPIHNNFVNEPDLNSVIFNQTTLDAIAEAERISRDPNVPSYNTMEDLKTALESD